MTHVRACAWVIVLLASLALSVTASGENLIVNGDAEAGRVGGEPPAWSMAGYDGKTHYSEIPVQTVSGGHEGAQSIKMTRPADWEWAYVQEIVPVSFDRCAKCVFTVWLKADKDLPRGVDLALLPVGRDDKLLNSCCVIKRYQRVDVTTSWKAFSTSMDVMPVLDHDGKPIEGKIRAIIQLYQEASLYIDDASLVLEAPGDDDQFRMDLVRKVLNEQVPACASPVDALGGIIEIPGGRLLAFTHDWSMRESIDGGQTWTDKRPLDLPDKYGRLSGVIRTRKGTIGVWNEGWKRPIYFWKSADGGKTWSKRITMGPQGAPLHGNRMIETAKGRLVLPVREGREAPARLKEGRGSFGVDLNGARIKTETHGHIMEMVLSWVYYSDDGGNTWKRSQGDCVIWKDDGYGGMWYCDEPNVAELSDGRLLMFFRTQLGRMYQATSPDHGVTWDYPEPTDLPASISPCALKRVPETPYTKKTGRAGDLLVVWNNVSADEIHRGFRRGRLCSAVSRDGGKTWEHVKTLDTAGLPPLDRMAELSPPAMTRGNDDLGKLPAPMGEVDYPDVAFAGEKNVLVKYQKCFITPKIGIGGRLQILPLDWFYADE